MSLLRSGAVVDYENELVAVIRHDARDLPLDDESVDLIVTSPPYFALRSYRDDGEHYAGQIGSEEIPEEYLQKLDECMVEWGRVLKPSGSVWINLGDKYVSDNRGSGVDAKRGEAKHAPVGPPGYPTGGWAHKSLMGLPWRFTIRQIDNGWILRAEVIWDKPNGLPESVTDRVRRSHEQWFHFVKEPRYFSGVDEIREPAANPTAIGREQTRDPRSQDSRFPDKMDGRSFQPEQQSGVAPHPLGRLPGSVWTVPSEPLLIPDDTREALDLPDHFAAFPQEFPRRIILGWASVGGIVLDPMGGTGTVAGVARMLGRYGISNDLSVSYNRLAIWRITQSGHFTKTEQRSWADRQGQLI